MTLAAIRDPCDEGLVTGAAPTEGCPERNRPYILAATTLGSALAFIDGTAVNVALPAMQADLQTDVAGLQWIVSAFTLSLAAFILIGGAAGDQLGRRRIYVYGVGLFTLASVACGVAPGTASLVIARGLQGVGAALLVPGSLSILAASFPAQTRGRAIGTWAAFAAITTALGPVLGGALVDSIGWRAIFFINVPIAVIVLVLVARYVPESRDETAVGPLDYPGAITAAIGLGLITFGLIIMADDRITGSTLSMVFILGGAFLGYFLLQESRALSPMLPLGLFRSSSFSGANLMTLLLYFALSGALFFLPFNLIQVQGYSAMEAGAAFLPLSILIGGLSRFSGILVDRVGPRRPLIFGPMIAGAGFAMMALPGIGGSYWVTFFPAILVTGLGMAIAVAPLTTTVMNSVDAAKAGIASGVNNAASRIAGLMAVAVMGVVAVSLFRAGLEPQIMALAPAEAPGVLERAAALATLPPPQEMRPATAEIFRMAVDRAFVDAFQWIALITGAIAFMAGLVAALTIKPVVRQTETMAPVDQAETV